MNKYIDPNNILISINNAKYQLINDNYQYLLNEEYGLDQVGLTTDYLRILIKCLEFEFELDNHSEITYSLYYKLSKLINNYNISDYDIDNSLQQSSFNIFYIISSKTAEWGYILGDIQNQTDLINLLNYKADKTDSIITPVTIVYDEEENQFIVSSIEGNVIKWTVNLVEYKIPSPQKFPFTPATDGFYRKDIIVFGEGDVQYIQGVESENTPLEPSVPENTIFLTSIDIFGDNANPIEPTPDGYAKLNGGNNFNGNQNVQGFVRANYFDSNKGIYLISGRGSDPSTDTFLISGYKNVDENSFIGIQRAFGDYGFLFRIDSVTGVLDLTATPTVNGVPIGGGDVQSVNFLTGDIEIVGDDYIDVQVDYDNNTIQIALNEGDEYAQYINGIGAEDNEITLTTDNIPEGDNKYFIEAPIDGKTYGRSDAEWVEVGDGDTPTLQKVTEEGATTTINVGFGGSASNARASFEANTATIASIRLKPGPTDYTGSEFGAVTNVNGDIKVLTSDGNVSLIKSLGNEILEGSDARMVEVNASGDISAVSEIVIAEITDVDLIDDIETASYVNNRATVVGVKAGQYYFNSTYKYEVLEDNLVQRNLVNNNFLPTQQTGYAVSFDNPYIYNTPSVTSSSNITFSFTNAKFGQVQKMYHNAATEPTLPSQVVLLTGEYVTGELNLIYFEYVSNTRVEYWIVQEA